LLDFLIVAAFGVLGLLAHAARKRKWLEWLLRSFIFNVFVMEALLYGNKSPDLAFNAWAAGSVLYLSCATLLLLSLPLRKVASLGFTALDIVFSGQLFIWLWKRSGQFLVFFDQQRIFVPTSIPHMVGLFVYVSTFFNLLSTTDPVNFELPALPLPLPIPIGQLFMYNGLGLVLLAFCGIGIFISRDPAQAISRLGWVRPSRKEVVIGVLLILFSFLYEAAWALITHSLSGQDLASKLSAYNAGTFSVQGGFVPSVLLAVATALCAGIGEETLIRGALQPVFGIFPAALLHGLLHGQFAHAPVFIVQVALWSVIFGIVRRYTSTTTTIIGHAGFNFLTTFLFAFNP
jgi:hypothetical protein